MERRIKKDENRKIMNKCTEKRNKKDRKSDREVKSN
jgi:hypothetical protein